MNVSYITEIYFTRLSRKRGADNDWKGKDTDQSRINHIQNQDKGRIAEDALKCSRDTMGIAEFFCAVFLCCFLTPQSCVMKDGLGHSKVCSRE